MAKFEKVGIGDFNEILKKLHDEIIGRSVSAKLEESSDFQTPSSRLAVRVYERYSYLGKNRVSLTLVLLQSNERIHLSLTTSGGSQAVFFKVNSFGEKSFLNSVKKLADSLIK